MVFVACTDLEKLRAGQLSRLDNMGAFQIVKHAGSVSAINGFNRPTYLDEVAKSLPHLDSKGIFDELNERSKSRGSGAMTLNTSGMLEQDQSAVYYGGVATVTPPRWRQRAEGLCQRDDADRCAGRLNVDCTPVDG